MAVHPMELSYRLGVAFNAPELIQLLDRIRQEIGFDEETRYDLMLEDQNNQRAEYEITGGELAKYITPAAWSLIHQVVFSNHWIKDMNLKVSVVRRTGGCTLSIKGEVDQPETAKRLAGALERQVQALLQAEAACNTFLQERERLFGAMLLAAGVADQAREPFLRGDFLGSLQAAYTVFTELLQRLLKVNAGRPRDVEKALGRNPPRLLLPDSSGARLRRELGGLARLMAGADTLLSPILAGREPAPADPAKVLKYLVLISLIVERLEVSTLNPAAFRRPARSPKPRPRKTKAAGPARAKSVKKAAAPSRKAKKSAPASRRRSA